MSETLTLQRNNTSKEVTFGQIFRNGQQICVTLEPINCIRAGTYLCIPHNGPKFKNIWEVSNVPDHTAILIHNGNTLADTHGCVLVGDTYGSIGGLPAVMNSKLTLAKMQAELPDTFYLYIKGAA